MNNEQTIRAAFIAYIRKHNRCPNWSTIGTTYSEGNPVFEAMLADGTLVRRIQISPKGRRMEVIRLGDGQ
jgi:hypothetical protein